MDLYEQSRDGTLVLRPNGRLDSSTSEFFRAEVAARIESGATAIVIDLKDLDYISSAGLRVILIAAKLIKAKQGNLALCHMSDHVREVFDVSGFSTILDLHDDVDKACRSCE